MAAIPEELNGAFSWESGDREDASMGNHIRWGVGKRKMPELSFFRRDSEESRSAQHQRLAHRT